VLREAKQLALRQQTGGPGEWRGERYRSLVLAWQAVAQAVLALVAESARDCEGFVSEGEQQRRLWLEEDLLAVCDGKAPCAIDGCIMRPSWTDRRSARRVLLALSAKARCRGVEQPVKLLDASQSGLGISSVETARSGDFIAIALKSGRRLFGRVAWTSGERTGVALCTPLTPTDPLLLEGRFRSDGPILQR
jgi:hypothetical protein